MPDQITRLLDQIDRQSIEARRYPESAQFEELLEHTGRLAQAVRAVLKECDRFQKSATALHENPLADHSDNVRADAWRVMVAFIAEEITDALGDGNE